MTFVGTQPRSWPNNPPPITLACRKRLRQMKTYTVKTQAAYDRAYYAGASAFLSEGHSAKNPYDHLFKDRLNNYLWFAWNQGFSDQITYGDDPIQPSPKGGD